MAHKRSPPNGVIAAIIAEQFPEKYRGWAVDVGASDGVSINSTWFLEKEAQWNVLSIEPNPFFREYLTKHRAWVECVAIDEIEGDDVEMTINERQPEVFSSLRPTHDPEEVQSAGFGFSRVNYESWPKVKVPVRRLETVLNRWEFPKLDALCIDTEGTELSVLKSLDLKKWRPKVIVAECWKERGPVNSYLIEMGYDFKERNHMNNVFLLRSE